MWGQNFEIWEVLCWRVGEKFLEIWDMLNLVVGGGGKH